MAYDLDRFLSAQEHSYDQALSEIRSGRKCSHWMWYIFPQLKGLGMTDTANYYGIDGLEEAKVYMQHPVLGARLIEMSEALLMLEETDPEKIFGYPDYLKCCSCMTLFEKVSDNPVFGAVLDKFYSGKRDQKTCDLC